MGEEKAKSLPGSMVGENGLMPRAAAGKEVKTAGAVKELKVVGDVKEAKKAKKAKRGHHSVYVVYLRDPTGDGRAGYYVGMTGLTPERRFENHKSGIKAARIVRRFGERLVPRLYSHLNPMPYAKAQQMEVDLADSLRKRGYLVFGGH
jgi:hypothetical protein